MIMLEKNLDDLGLLGLRGKNRENERKKCFELKDSDVLDYTLYPKLKQN